MNTRWLKFVGVLLTTPCWASEASWQNAYVEQNLRFLAAYQGAPAGFKAGLSSRASQHRFNSDRAVYGSLPPDSRYDSGSALSLVNMVRPMVELELAFQARQVIDRPLDSVAQLRAAIGALAIAVEVPDLVTIAPGASAQDIAAANVAAKAFLVGKPQRLSSSADQDLDTRLLRLRHQGEVLVKAAAGDIEGGQWQALLALVNQRIAMGWKISPEQWLLTGALGGMAPLAAGHYRAELEGAAALEFWVE